MTEFGVAECHEKPLAFLGHSHGDFGFGLAAEHLLENAGAVVEARGTAPLLASRIAKVMGSFTHCESSEHPPQAVAIREVREATLLRIAAETIECAEGDILFIRRTPRRIAKPLASEPDEPVEVAIPERTHRFGIASLKLADPESHRIRGGHKRHSWMEKGVRIIPLSRVGDNEPRSGAFQERCPNRGSRGQIRKCTFLVPWFRVPGIHSMCDDKTARRQPMKNTTSSMWTRFWDALRQSLGTVCC